MNFLKKRVLILDLTGMLKSLENCPCGKKHTFYTKDIEIGSGITAKTGEILCINKDGLTVACADRAILIKTVKPESKGKMCACDFANGKRLKKGDIL